MEKCTNNLNRVVELCCFTHVAIVVIVYRSCCFAIILTVAGKKLLKYHFISMFLKEPHTWDNLLYLL